MTANIVLLTDRQVKVEKYTSYDCGWLLALGQLLFSTEKVRSVTLTLFPSTINVTHMVIPYFFFGLGGLLFVLKLCFHLDI